MNSFFCDMIGAHVLRFDKPTLSELSDDKADCSVFRQHAYTTPVWSQRANHILQVFSVARMLSAAAKPTDIL